MEFQILKEFYNNDNGFQLIKTVEGYTVYFQTPHQIYKFEFGRSLKRAEQQFHKLIQ